MAPQQNGSALIIIIIVGFVVGFTTFMALTDPLPIEIIWGITLGSCALILIGGGIFWVLRRFNIIPTVTEWRRARRERREREREEDLERRRVAAMIVDVEAVSLPDEAHVRRW